jgi:hypothetical protein
VCNTETKYISGLSLHIRPNIVQGLAVHVILMDPPYLCQLYLCCSKVRLQNSSKCNDMPAGIPKNAMHIVMIHVRE